MNMFSMQQSTIQNSINVDERNSELDDLKFLKSQFKKNGKSLGSQYSTQSQEVLNHIEKTFEHDDPSTRATGQQQNRRRKVWRV